MGITVEAYPVGTIATLVIPGGPGVYALQENTGWLTFLVTVAARSGRICSVCTGAFLAAAAGLLDGKRAVTHWRSCARLAALGRKSWLFAGSDRGGERAAAMYALIIIAKLNDVDPRAWPAEVLAKIADHPASRLHELLTWNWKHDQAKDAAAA